MCAATVFDVRPLNVALTCNVWAVGSRITVASPVPGDTTGGTSFAPLRFAVKMIGIALAVDSCSINPATEPNAQDKYFISLLPLVGSQSGRTSATRGNVIGVYSFRVAQKQQITFS